MLEILTGITEGKGTMEDLDRLEDLAWTVQQGSLCQLGKTAPNPVLSTLKYFRDEYEAHILDHTCPGGVCKALIEYYVIADNCTGCDLCARRCPTGAAQGERKEPHTIDQELCIQCGVCFDVCRFDAIGIR